MKQAFLDTVGLIAIWDEQDQWHAPAEAAWMELVKTGASLVTTSHVLLECGNALARTPFRARE